MWLNLEGKVGCGVEKYKSIETGKPFTKTTIDPDFDNSLKNLLNEQFNPEKPNAIWCSDITYIHTKTGFAYLTSIMDLFSRRIIAWRLSETLEAKWVVECVHEAKKSRHTTRPLILHYLFFCTHFDSNSWGYIAD
jgi:putative transposase